MGKYFGAIRLCVNAAIMLTCGVLYFKSIMVVRASKTIDRKGTLTYGFAAVGFAWVILVLPHLIFVDFFLPIENKRLLGWNIYLETYIQYYQHSNLLSAYVSDTYVQQYFDDL